MRLKIFKILYFKCNKLIPFRSFRSTFYMKKDEHYFFKFIEEKLHIILMFIGVGVGLMLEIYG